MRVTCDFDTTVEADLEMLQRMFTPNGAANADWPPKSAVQHIEDAAASANEAVKPEPAPEPVKEPEPEPTPEPVEVAETFQDEPVEAEIVEETPADTSVTMDDAVKKATKLVSEGQAGKVREALNTIGAKRVSELQQGDLAAFMEALG